MRMRCLRIPTVNNGSNQLCDKFNGRDMRFSSIKFVRGFCSWHLLQKFLNVLTGLFHRHCARRTEKSITAKLQCAWKRWLRVRSVWDWSWPRVDASRQSRKRINSFAAASFVNSTLPDPTFYIGLYREIAQRRLGAEYTGKWEICRKLAEAKEKVATHTIWGLWPTTGGFECRFPGHHLNSHEWISPRSFFWTMRWTAMITIPNQLACVAFTTAVWKIPAHSSAILCLWWCTKRHITYGKLQVPRHPIKGHGYLSYGRFVVWCRGTYVKLSMGPAESWHAYYCVGIEHSLARYEAFQANINTYICI